MSRVALIHWKTGEAEERADRIRRAGHEVRAYAEHGGDAVRALREVPPEVIVIDLSRLPSHGREAATFLRQQKATRHTPLVFVDGKPDKVRPIRTLLPDAIFTPWSRIRSALKSALRSAPSAPVIPAGMERYAGRPLSKKLGVKEGLAVTLLGAPPGFDETLGPLPAGVRLRRRARGSADLIVLFARSRAVLERRFAPATRCLRAGGSIWLAWPKRASGVATDLTQTDVRRYGLDRSLVDYKICSIDETWSGLRFARRKGATDG